MKNPIDPERLDYLQGEIQALQLAMRALLVTHPQRESATALAARVLTEAELSARVDSIPRSLGFRAIRELMGLPVVNGAGQHPQ